MTTIEGVTVTDAGARLLLRALDAGGAVTGGRGERTRLRQDGLITDMAQDCRLTVKGWRVARALRNQQKAKAIPAPTHQPKGAA